MNRSTIRKYYSIAGIAIVMNNGKRLEYLLTSPSGCVVAVIDNAGTLLSQQGAAPWMNYCDILTNKYKIFLLRIHLSNLY